MKRFYIVYQTPGHGYYFIAAFQESERPTLQKQGMIGQGLREFDSKPKAKAYIQEKISEQISFLKHNLNVVKSRKS